MFRRFSFFLFLSSAVWNKYIQQCTTSCAAWIDNRTTTNAVLNISAGLIIFLFVLCLCQSDWNDDEGSEFLIYISWFHGMEVIIMLYSFHILLVKKSGWHILLCFVERIVENSCETSENPFHQMVCFFHNCLGHKYFNWLILEGKKLWQSCGRDVDLLEQAWLAPIPKEEKTYVYVFYIHAIYLSFKVIYFLDSFPLLLVRCMSKCRFSGNSVQQLWCNTKFMQMTA